MKKIVRTLLLLAIPIYMSGCGIPSSPPEFKDGNATLNQLKAQWNCETIEFENWEDDEIAVQVKNSLKNAEKYQAYYVIFVTQQGNLLSGARVHSLGGRILAEDL